MVINYHTGIKMVGYHGYNGIRMYAGYKADGTPTGEVMSVGNGDYNVRVKNHLLNEGNIYIGKSSGSNRLDINTNSVTSGIDLDGRDSLTGFSGDSWLRLNQSGHWGSGVYTPGHFRADGEIRQGGSDYGGYNIQTNGTIYANDYICLLYTSDAADDP
mgnify:FL=1